MGSCKGGPDAVCVSTSREAPLKWRLGPGLITAVSDDDPSNIATYSQVGAQFGYQLLWAIWVYYPLLAAIQEVSARLGRTTGRGLGANLRRYYPPWLSYVLVGLLLVANIVNIGADLLAMGSGLELVLGGPRLLYAFGFALLSAGLEVFVQYKHYSNLLKWFSVTLLSYVGVAFAAHADWHAAMLGLVPSFRSAPGYTMALVAIAGTTISPYLFFWQAGQEAEIERVTPGKAPLVKKPAQAANALSRIRFDTYTGMAFSQSICFFIVITAAATLSAHGITHVDTARQAAVALRPLAGELAFLVFSLGIIATGLLAIPALAGACAYAVADLLGWPSGLSLRFSKARRFYLVLAGSTLLGLLIDFAGVSSMRALYLSAVLNGLVAVPIMVMMMLLASRPTVMGRFVLPPGVKWLGWGASAAMAASGLVLIGQNLFH